MKELWNIKQPLTLIFLGFLLACTGPLIGPHSQIAYQNATSLKAETLALMDKSTESYDTRKADIEKLFVDANKALEFVKGVPSNSISSRQWEILIKRDGDLMGKFFSRWETSETKTLSPAYVGEFKPIVADAFDEIICLEANKKAAKKCSEKGSN